METSLQLALPFLLGNEAHVLPIDIERWELSRMLRSISKRVDAGNLVGSSEFEDFFGTETVPVELGAMASYGGSTRTHHTIADLLARIRSSDEVIYGKDWHFMLSQAVRECNLCCHLYEVPGAFRDDWLNWFYERCRGGADDYRFIYIGSVGSRTALHHDVLCSYSWSVNLVGYKRWYFWSPKDLPTSVWSDDTSFASMPPPFERHPPSRVVVSGPGDAIFVPSGWYHYVENIRGGGEIRDDKDTTTERMTISVNHNWFNGFNIYCVWRFLLKELAIVCEAMLDFLDTPSTAANKGLSNDLLMNRSEWNSHCNMTLKANSALSLSDFVELLASRVLYTWVLVHQGDADSHINMPSWAPFICSAFLKNLKIDESDVALFQDGNKAVLNTEQLLALDPFSWTFSSELSTMLQKSFGFESDPGIYLRFLFENQQHTISVTQFGLRNIALIVKELLSNDFLLDVWADRVTITSREADMRKMLAELYETTLELYLNLQ